MSASASSVGGKETQLQTEEAWSPQELTITQNISLKTRSDSEHARGGEPACVKALGGIAFFERLAAFVDLPGNKDRV